MNALDTHRLVKRLADVSNLATKADVTQLRTEVSALEARLHAAIAESKADLLKWVIGLLLVQGGVVVTLIKLLPGR